MVDVLIVDSDRSYRSAIAAGLSAEHISVRTASTPQQAVDELDESRSDIIITEMLLPNHNGLALLQHLQSYADWQSIPVIVVTQLSPDQITLNSGEWQQYGVVAYYQKSKLDFTELKQQVMNEATGAA